MDYACKMPTRTYLCIICISFTISWTTVTGNGPVEYCITDSFAAQCKLGEVIKIKSAVYGRMKIGKCVLKSMGYLGCQKDVLSLLSRACSGKQTCSYPVKSDELLDIRPCEELTAYLEVDFDCISVLNRPTVECESSSTIVTHDSHGYISSYVAKKSGCGNMDHPWKIEVLPGERVNFTLQSFAAKTVTRKCKALGYIIEKGHRNNVTICSKEGQKEHIYTSNGLQLQIHLKSDIMAEEYPAFLLHYKVFGCADLKVPVNGWYKREGDVATVGCESQDLIWTLKCEGNQWTGVVGNCTENVAASIQQSYTWFDENLDLKKLTIICFAVGFVILIVIAGTVIIWKWKESNQHKPPSTVLLQEEQYRMNKGPLPPVPQDNSHYRSLIRQPGPQGFQAQSHTMPRPQPQDMQGCDDYSSDWRFGTAPWQKPNV